MCILVVHRLLFRTILFFFTINLYTAFRHFICISNDVHYLDRHSVHYQDIPQALTMDTIECCLKVDEVDFNRGLEFKALFYDLAKCEYLIGA